VLNFIFVTVWLIRRASHNKTTPRDQDEFHAQEIPDLLFESKSRGCMTNQKICEKKQQDRNFKSTGAKLFHPSYPFRF